MLKAIYEASFGPIWAFLVRVALELGVFVPREEVLDKMEEAGASEDRFFKAADMVQYYDGPAFLEVVERTLHDLGRDVEEEGAQRSLLWTAAIELEHFLRGPRWSNAIRVARAIRPCNDERVIAACLVAAMTARPIVAIADE
jgi:hypothetical protein